MTATTDAPARTPQTSANGTPAKAVRAWLRDNGHEVGSRGSLSADQLALFDAAHPA